MIDADTRKCTGNEVDKMTKWDNRHGNAHYSEWL